MRAFLRILGVLVCMSCAQSARASIVFQENFDQQLDPAKWSLSLGDGSLTIDSGIAALSSPAGAFPYLSTVSDPFPPTGDFSLRIRFRYPTVLRCGNGFGSTTIATHPYFYGFSLWIGEGFTPSGTVGDTFPIVIAAASDGMFHEYEWRYMGGTYSLYLDGTLVASDASVFRPSGMFFGHPPGASCSPWTSQEIDYVIIDDLDDPPVIDPFTVPPAAEGSVTDVPVHAADPDGDQISLSLSAPTFASLVPGNNSPGDVTSSVRLAPGYQDAGIYPGNRLTATTARASVSFSFDIIVLNRNRAPEITAPAGVQASEGAAITFRVSASDPDGDHATLTATNRPVGSIFIDHGDNTGDFSWTPGFGQAGDYTVTFTGRDDLGATASRDVTISVDNVNRAPVAAPGGPYSGVIDVPMTLNGTASVDPDGDALSYLWDFGDGMTGVGATPLHSYSAGGVFTVTLTVSDGSLSASASTIATIQDIFPARAFLEGGNQTTRLGSGRATTCAQIEPVNGSYAITAVDPAMIVMISPGTGSVDRISAIAAKTVIGGDRDRNGIDEITACFAKTDLRLLFSALPGGRHTVTVTLEGNLTTGGKFRATMDMEVVSSGGSLVASLSPNPVNPVATLTIQTSRAGKMRVQLFDAQGRLVRVPLESQDIGAGYHDVLLDGRNENGERLRSGVYFYRIEATEGVETGRFVIAR